MIKHPSELEGDKKKQQSADPHIFEHGVLFQTIWTLEDLVSSGTP